MTDHPITLPDHDELLVDTVDTARWPNPLIEHGLEPVEDDHGLLCSSDIRSFAAFVDRGELPPAFEPAGPRRLLGFDPRAVTAGVVTCGGLCPGTNDVIRSLTLTLLHGYGVRRVIGYRYGFAGLADPLRLPPLALTAAAVRDVHLHGGTVLGSSRGPQDPDAMVRTLVHDRVSMLFCIGGDGSVRGASAIVAAVRRLGHRIAVVSVPKTIDNDLDWVDRSFGFATAVDAAARTIGAAHVEARGALDGIGLVKLMGRHSGFIAAHASLARPDVNLCLVPEVPFTLAGDGGVVDVVARRLARRRHAVIVVAEGAGQDLLAPPAATDASGNTKLADVGTWLRDHLRSDLGELGVHADIKYLDPSYEIRSLPANATDAAFCLSLGQMAAHAAMAGKTDVVVGYHQGRFTHLPNDLVTRRRRQVQPTGDLWQRVLQSTGQPLALIGDPARHPETTAAAT
ncbi:ATP-dependent 6-phosphofructokinase [Desertimonas flava]|uniref:ATP-dependent 6-phosphofructokinase n=1 Tax=Desertimonas flava TaxID=2064846 RepID=UPI000E34C548|nr:ATP-dependent 6-phosphofructokinase [Desertimonas flava]